MNSLQQNLQRLYQRDLDRLIENIEATPDELLWSGAEGITNSCGVLAQHLVGNLNHFIGYGVGNTGYERNREREFTTTNVSKEELIRDIKDLKNTLNDIFDVIEEDRLDDEYPLDVPFEASTGGFLIHLYGHLNYHLGQINYLRRILAKSG